jgi:hypothetical protein
LLVLRPNDLCLLRFLGLRQEYGFLDLKFLLSTLLLNHVVLSRLISFKFSLLLHLSFFLSKQHVNTKCSTKSEKELTCRILSSFRFLSETISLVRFRVSSIFFHVFISSYLSRAIRLANRLASCSIAFLRFFTSASEAIYASLKAYSSSSPFCYYCVNSKPLLFCSLSILIKLIIALKKYDSSACCCHHFSHDHGAKFTLLSLAPYPRQVFEDRRRLSALILPRARLE